MTKLTIVLGEHSVTLSKSIPVQWVYRIGATGRIIGSFEELNDASRLQEIAREIREDYAKWIYSLNDTLSKGPSPFFGVSPFLLSDCSCKRTEFFPGFNLVCNLLFLREIIENRRPTEIEVFGGDKQFVRSLRKMALGVPVGAHSTSRRREVVLRRILSDIRYCLEVALIIFLYGKRGKLQSEVRSRKRVFFTIFPKMFDLGRGDRKYGKFFRQGDHYIASIVTDGFHQHVSIRDYRRLRSDAKSQGVSVVDDYFRHKDWVRGLIWILPLRFRFHVGQDDCKFRGIDTYLWIQDELRLSASRLSRFVVLSGALSRFLQSTPMVELVYYLHEYPIGRLISFLVSSVCPAVATVGYQHGPAAWAKMVYCIDPEETREGNEHSKSVPMPDRVLAEDRKSAEIYNSSGYKNVEVLDKIWRLDYLDGIRSARESDRWLIAPGLHDGPIVLSELRELLDRTMVKEVLLRPHPLARNEYLADISSDLPIKITSESISDLLGRVGAVLVSYSSVGEEALKLGIPVYFVQIPGLISESTLAEIQPGGGWIVNQ